MTYDCISVYSIAWQQSYVIHGTWWLRVYAMSAAQYFDWINEADAPAILTHQLPSRLFANISAQYPVSPINIPAPTQLYSGWHLSLQWRSHLPWKYIPHHAHYSEKRKMSTYWDVSQYHWVLVIAAPWPLSSPITLNIAILQYSNIAQYLSFETWHREGFFSFDKNTLHDTKPPF